MAFRLGQSGVCGDHFACVSVHDFVFHFLLPSPLSAIRFFLSPGQIGLTGGGDMSITLQATEMAAERFPPYRARTASAIFGSSIT
jgi:hypothetical protein